SVRGAEIDAGHQHLVRGQVQGERRTAALGRGRAGLHQDAPLDQQVHPLREASRRAAAEVGKGPLPGRRLMTEDSLIMPLVRRKGAALPSTAKRVKEGCMHPVRIAIAGTGMIGAVHADAARRAGAQITGVAASTPERAKAAAERLGVARSFGSAEELVTAEDVDVVHICTPNSSHGPLTRLALAAGKHVVCEKPLSVDAADAAELAALAEQSGLVTAVPFVYRYHAMAAEARHRVRSGSIGAVRLIHGHYLQDWLSQPTDDNWRVDPVAGGASRAFADIGSHWCDLVEWVTGHRIVELAASVQTMVPERAAP